MCDANCATAGEIGIYAIAGPSAVGVQIGCVGINGDVARVGDGEASVRGNEDVDPVAKAVCMNAARPGCVGMKHQCAILAEERNAIDICFGGDLRRCDVFYDQRGCRWVNFHRTRPWAGNADAGCKIAGTCHRCTAFRAGVGDLCLSDGWQRHRCAEDDRACRQGCAHAA